MAVCTGSNTLTHLPQQVTRRTPSANSGPPAIHSMRAVVGKLLRHVASPKGSSRAGSLSVATILEMGIPPFKKTLGRKGFLHWYELPPQARDDVRKVPKADICRVSVRPHFIRSSGREAVCKAYSNPSIDTFAVVISFGNRISLRPFATATFCVPLTE